MKTLFAKPYTNRRALALRMSIGIFFACVTFVILALRYQEPADDPAKKGVKVDGGKPSVTSTSAVTHESSVKVKWSVPTLEENCLYILKKKISTKEFRVVCAGVVPANQDKQEICYTDSSSSNVPEVEYVLTIVAENGSYSETEIVANAEHTQIIPLTINKP